MPVYRIQTPTGPAMQWGKQGIEYPYDLGDPKSRKRAQKQAEAQGRAIRATGWAEDTNIRND